MKIAVLPGDGIGPEVVEEAIKVLESAARKFNLEFRFTYSEVGGDAYDKYRTALPQATVRLCENSDAILFGSVGGPKWDDLPKNERIETTSLLGLRKHFNLFANLRPSVCYRSLVNISPIKNEIIGNGFDFLIVRELAGGAYYGEKKLLEESAFDMIEYKKFEIERIAEVAFRSAMKRRKHLTCIDKSNVLATSILFRQYVTEIASRFPHVDLDFMYIDNATMQIIKRPHAFDVIVTSNMFGDIISDEAAMVAGSIGMMPSASINEKNFGLYEPAGGSAPDIAGKGIANPIAQIMSAAMMMKYSFGRDDVFEAIENAMIEVIEENRTKDIMEQGKNLVTTKEMGDLIAAKI